MDFLPGIDAALVTEKPGRMWLVDVAQRAEAAGRAACRAVVVSAARAACSTSSPSPTLRRRSAGLSDLFRAVARTAAAGSRWRGRSWSRGSGAAAGGLQVIWRDPAGGEGGQFGAIIAFAPDGKSLFLSSGERQRFTPAQDPSQPLGKILHLTLDGKPAPGNPLGGQHRRARRSTVTDPPEDTEAARSAPAAAGHLAGAEPHAGGDLEHSAIAIPTASPSRRTGGCGKPRWVRAAATSST